MPAREPATNFTRQFQSLGFEVTNRSLIQDGSSNGDAKQRIRDAPKAVEELFHTLEHLQFPARAYAERRKLPLGRWPE